MEINRKRCPECQGEAFYDDSYIEEYVCCCSECGNVFTIEKGGKKRKQ